MPTLLLVLLAWVAVSLAAGALWAALALRLQAIRPPAAPVGAEEPAFELALAPSAGESTPQARVRTLADARRG
jgi:hypothetical protein